MYDDTAGQRRRQWCIMVLRALVRISILLLFSCLALMVGLWVASALH